MDNNLEKQIKQTNPWLNNANAPILKLKEFRNRVQINELLDKEWDSVWTILTGPRRSGKTTIGKHLSSELIKIARYSNLLYLNCDYLDIRSCLKNPLFISEAIKTFKLKRPIIFIDEVQRLENPGLLLKALIDLNLDVKYIASGSSQLELKSKVTENLTGRQFNSLVLPLSHAECADIDLETRIIFGSYPQIIAAKKKKLFLAELYKDYIQKDIVEILRIGKPDILQMLLGLIAHSSGQIINYSLLATDCKVSSTLISNYISILKNTYVIQALTPFVGNKRSELTSNPKLYFIDNGFRNHALRNFLNLESRIDCGLLIEGFIFQELLKYKTQHYLDIDIHYWRTKAGAEIEFVLYKNKENITPIEVKYRNFNRSVISRGYRSFVEAYKPHKGFIITKNWSATIQIETTQIYFIPLNKIDLTAFFNNDQ